MQGAKFLGLQIGDEYSDEDFEKDNVNLLRHLEEPETPPAIKNSKINLL